MAVIESSLTSSEPFSPEEYSPDPKTIIEQINNACEAQMVQARTSGVFDLSHRNYPQLRIKLGINQHTMEWNLVTTDQDNKSILIHIGSGEVHIGHKTIDDPIVLGKLYWFISRSERYS